MSKHTLRVIYQILLCMTSVLWLSACSNTFQGMKRDLREDTNSDDQPHYQTRVVKTTTIIHSSQEPTSLPPLETPSQ